MLPRVDRSRSEGGFSRQRVCVVVALLLLVLYIFAERNAFRPHPPIIEPPAPVPPATRAQRDLPPPLPEMPEFLALEPVESHVAMLRERLQRETSERQRQESEREAREQEQQEQQKQRTIPGTSVAEVERKPAEPHVEPTKTADALEQPKKAEEKPAPTDTPKSGMDPEIVALLEPSPLALLPPSHQPPFRPVLGAVKDRVHPSLSDLQPKDHLRSSMFCIGSRGRLGTHDDTSCRFRNICVNLELPPLGEGETESKHIWEFYRDPAEADWPLLTMDNGAIQTDFPRPLLNLRSMGNEKDAQYWTPTKISGLIPSDSSTYWPRADPSVPDLFVLYHGHYPSNMGHVIGDDLFPIFNLMSSFRMLSNTAQLLTSRSCQSIFGAGESKKAKTCSRFMSIFPRGVTDRAVLSLHEIEALRGALKVPEGARRVCFENLLAGLSPFGFQQSLGRADEWRAYHDFYLSNIGLYPGHTPRKQRIVVSIKDGNRGFRNTKEVIQHLREKFGSRYEVHAIELRSLTSWKNELAYLLDTSVLVTPCGGVSMSAMFLPKGSAMVIVDYFSTKLQQSVGMEDKLWSNTGYIRPFHYPFTAPEVYLPERGVWNEPLSRDDFGHMRTYGQVIVDLPRLEELVRAAVEHVENFMIKGLD